MYDAESEDFARVFRQTVGPGDWRIVMLRGYFDDTNTHGEGVTAIGGFLFDEHGLEAFSEGWRTELAPRLREGAKPFHAVDCFHRHGQFHSWPREDCDQFLGDLARLIQRTRGAGLFAGLEAADYRAYVAANPGVERHLGSPFAVCVVKLLLQAEFWANREGFKSDIYYWFECGTSGEKHAADILRTARADKQMADKHRIAGYGFTKKGSAAALFAADLLVWEFQRNMAKTPEAWSERMNIMRDGPPLYAEVLKHDAIGVVGAYNALSGLSADF